MKVVLTVAVTLILISSAQVWAQGDGLGKVKFKPEKLRYSSVLMGRCEPRKIEAKNNGDSAISDPAFRIVEGADVFSLQGRGKCPNPLEPGDTCRDYVNFCPDMFGRYEGLMVFTGSDRKIPLTGSANQGGR